MVAFFHCSRASCLLPLGRLAAWDREKETQLIIVYVCVLFENSFHFTEASTVQETLTDGVHKLEKSIDNLNIRLARLLAEYSASQAKLKQRIAKLELR